MYPKQDKTWCLDVTDFTDEAQTSKLTIWAPHLDINIQQGDVVTLLDARTSLFNGGSVSTADITHITVIMLN